MEEIFKALDGYLKDVAKQDRSSVIEDIVCSYAEHADIHIEWIEIY